MPKHVVAAPVARILAYAEPRIVTTGHIFFLAAPRRRGAQGGDVLAEQSEMPTLFVLATGTRRVDRYLTVRWVLAGK